MSQAAQRKQSQHEMRCAYFKRDDRCFQTAEEFGLDVQEEEEEEAVEEPEAGPSNASGQSAAKGKKNKISIALGKSKLECHVSPQNPYKEPICV